MKISLDYSTYIRDYDKLTDEQKQQMATPYDIVMSYIRGAVSQKFKNAVPTDKLRILMNIQKKFDEAERNASNEIPLNDYELMFIRDAYSTATFDINNMIPSLAVQDFIIEASEGKKTKTEGAE